MEKRRKSKKKREQRAEKKEKQEESKDEVDDDGNQLDNAGDVEMVEVRSESGPPSGNENLDTD